MHRLLQLTLDFFDAAPVAPVKRRPRKAPAKPAPTPAAPNVPHGPQRVDGPPAELLDKVLAPADFRHPQANREAMLGDSVVAYELRRGKRRTIGFAVGPEGLTVTAPKWVPLYEIDSAVQSKANWIVKKLGESGERQRRIESARIEWKEGAAFPFMGEQVIVVLDPRHGFDEVGAVLDTDTDSLPGVARHTLRVGLPQNAQPAQIRDAVQAWLMRQAKRLFTERLDHYAPKLGVKWRKLVLSNAGTRWGTAHSDGLIRLNWRLIHFRLPVIDYVVAHELSHLRVMDHSPRFWETVGRVVPDYEHLRGQLKDEHIPPW